MPSRNPPIEVLIVDDHRMFADALRLALSAQKGISVTAVAQDTERALASAAEKPPGVVLLDLDIPGRDSAELIRRLREAAPEAHVIVLTTDQGDLAVAQAVEAGARGHLSKFDPVDELIQTVRRAASGERLIGPQEARRLLGRLRHRRAERATAQQRADRLTRREVEILQRMADGVPADELAEVLGMRYRTLRTHLQNIIVKLGVHSKTEALAFAIRHGKVSPRG